MDASNILKPALASGELKCIGSTTYHDYKSYFERDRALARRFQKIEVAEPSHEEAIKILEGLKPHYEKHHGVHYSAGAIRAAVKLSAKHINDRLLTGQGDRRDRRDRRRGENPTVGKAAQDHRSQGRRENGRQDRQDSAAQRVDRRIKNSCKLWSAI